MHIGRGLAGSVGGFLPGAVTGLWDPQRDFAFLKLPTAGVKSVVALSRCVSRSSPAPFEQTLTFDPILSFALHEQHHHSTTPHVMVITSEGLFYSYAIDLENGGECVLQKSYSLLGDESNG